MSPLREQTSRSRQVKTLASGTERLARRDLVRPGAELIALTPHNQPYMRSSSVTVRHRWVGVDPSVPSLRVDASVVAVLCGNVKLAEFGPAFSIAAPASGKKHRQTNDDQRKPIHR
jgi:hypothetical protein